MGLDQYLYSKQYVKNWDFQKPEERTTITIQKGTGPVETIEVSYLIQEVGYWRKANMIQGWFADNVYGDASDSGTVGVDRDQLAELLATVKTVLAASELIPDPSADQYAAAGIGPDGLPIPPEHAVPKVVKDPSVALELLPPRQGFFFGSDTIDQWYIGDLIDTEEILTRALALPDDHYFEYEASY